MGGSNITYPPIRLDLDRIVEVARVAVREQTAEISPGHGQRLNGASGDESPSCGDRALSHLPDGNWQDNRILAGVGEPPPAGTSGPNLLPHIAGKWSIYSKPDGAEGAREHVSRAAKNHSFSVIMALYCCSRPVLRLRKG